MSGRTSSNDAPKAKSPSKGSSVPIVYNYQNYPQSGGGEEEDKKAAGGFDLHEKLLMLGDSGVGKSSLVLQYANEEFTSNFVTTIGIDYKIKLLNIGKTTIKLQIWDTVCDFNELIFDFTADYCELNINTDDTAPFKSMKFHEILGWTRKISYNYNFLFQGCRWNHVGV